ncbi:MAG: translocation/assembly module TamB domain-containing protein, partial [Pseudomonadota bacterium]
TLGVGVATLLDGGGGAVDGVRGAVGLDVLRVDDDAETGTSVTVGSNVADGVFVGAKQPVAGGSASVQVEVEVFDNITVDSEFGRDIGTSIGLNWKRDF